MSFSMDVKEELEKQIPQARHCRIAELAALLSFCGSYRYGEEGSDYVKISTDNLTVACKYFILLEKTFKIRPEVTVKNSHGSYNYQIIVTDSKTVQSVLMAVKIISEEELTKDGLCHHSSRDASEFTEAAVNGLLVQNVCCKRGYIRGAFLAAGSITDPNKSYHYEIVAGSRERAGSIQEILTSFDIDSKCMVRKNNCVVYVKEGAQISDILNIMEAHVALMKLENVRILKEMRNTINRKVNCEAANITRTSEASFRQQQDILYIRDHMGFDNLSEQLREIAMCRIDYPDASLKELAAMLHPPIGKSGVNHRLRKLSAIATELREHKEEKKNAGKED